ncbi:MAG: GNAT family N-acetyltransferase [Alphaproteobacteria bacterium]|nr:GNAT family N-acetyltransferase [Alphaproteobacteria bacterium]
MSKVKANPAVKSGTEPEIRMFEGGDPAGFEKIREYLTAYNEKKLSVKRNAALMTACIDGEVVGGISFRWYGDSAFLDYVAVGEKWHGQGIGRRLLEAVEEELRNRGCRQITLDTEGFQSPDFYRRLGYEVITTVPDYICGYDQLIMRKVISGKARGNEQQ